MWNQKVDNTESKARYNKLEFEYKSLLEKEEELKNQINQIDKSKLNEDITS